MPDLTASVANRFKRLIHAGVVHYRDSVPDHPGKLRLMRMADGIVGPALYEIDDLKLLLSPHRLIDSYILREGSYAPELVTFIRRIMSGGGSFVDVGANIGYLSMVAARAGGPRCRVYAFEPSPREYAFLLDHIALNEMMNVVPFPFGVGAADQSSVLWLAGTENPGQNSRFRQGASVAQVPVNLAPIDAMLSSEAMADVRCVKIDVEGDECSVLQGFSRVMPLLQNAAFLVEVSPDLLRSANHSADEIYEFFDQHGFRACQATRPTVSQWDELFVSASAPNPPGIWF